MKAYQAEYECWLRQTDLPKTLRQELEALAEDPAEQELSFGQIIPFGTGGMRGLMGPGINRMNLYTVRRAARGLAAWLLSTDLPKSCAIAYDSRHQSKAFAEVCAVALAECGVTAWLYTTLAPTPMLSFAVRRLRCGCGIVISASHNDGRYNGMKCYGADGCQLTDEPADAVYAAICATPVFAASLLSLEQALAGGLVRQIPDTVWEDYYHTVLAQRVGVDAEALRSLRIVYTPLNGTGNRPVRTVLQRLGVTCDVVPVQEEPDGDFTTCPYPNPETEEALAEAYRLSDRLQPDLIVATDPDADRVAVASKSPDGWRKLTGNELGCLLLDFILRCGKPVSDAEIVKSIVSTPMADAIAAHYGCRCVNVLTGFKYIGGEMTRLEQRGEEEKFLFGFEESCGYLKGSYARDKDGVAGAMLVAELAAWCKSQGRTLLDQLHALDQEYGFYRASVLSVEMAGLDGPAKISRFMDSLRSDPRQTLCGAQIVSTVDYLSGMSLDRLTGAQHATGLPSSNVYELQLADRSRIIARPSGTEPKLKLYFNAVGTDEAQAQKRLEELKAEFTSRLAELG